MKLNILSKLTNKSFSYSPSLMVDLPMATTEYLLLLQNIINWHLSSLGFIYFSENHFVNIELSFSNLLLRVSRSELHA